VVAVDTAEAAADAEAIAAAVEVADAEAIAEIGATGGTVGSLRFPPFIFCWLLRAAHLRHRFLV